MPPFGLSQFAHYYGYSFWDSETWCLLPVILSCPETARSLLEYRVRGIPAARRPAALFGYRGAQFPWEAVKGVAEWIESRCIQTDGGFEIRHIMWPDEGVSNVNNSSYVNVICTMVLAAAIECAQ